MKHKLLGIVLFVSMMSGFAGGWSIAAAQDVTATPAVTEVVVLPPVLTDVPVEVTAQPKPPVIVVNNPPATTDNINWADKFLEMGLALAVVFLAIKQGKLIPPETVDNVLGRFFELVKGITAKTETPLDDSLVGVTEEVIRKLVKQELAKQSGVSVASGVNHSLVG